jgi:hypothetical protein
VVLARTAQKKAPDFRRGATWQHDLDGMNRSICSTRRAARQIGEITALVQAICPLYKVKRQLWPGLVTGSRRARFGPTRAVQMTEV